MRTIILASASPRRKDLLNRIGLKFTVEESEYEENLTLNLPPAKLAEFLSFKKAQTVAKNHKDAIVIGADTLVVFENKIYGKPKDKKDAFNMLSKFSGNRHIIITGYTILDTKSGKSVTKSEKSYVYFKKMTKKEINWYVATSEPMGKAGSYAAQERGSMFVEQVRGDFFNVVGLPVSKVVEQLKKFGVTLF